MAGVVPGCRRGPKRDRAIVTKPEGVPELVARRFGNPLLVVAQCVREDKRRRIESCTEAPHERNAATRAATRLGHDRRTRCDDSPHAECEVCGVGLSQRCDTGVLGGDVNIERCVVIGNPLPNTLDEVLLGQAERDGVPVSVERRHRRLDEPGRVPSGSANRLTVEVEVQNAVGAWAAMQGERLAVREWGCGLRTTCGLSDRRRRDRLDVERVTRSVEPERIVVLHPLAQLLGREMKTCSDGVSVRAQPIGRLRTVAFFRENRRPVRTVRVRSANRYGLRCRSRGTHDEHHRQTKPESLPHRRLLIAGAAVTATSALLYLRSK